MRAFCEHWQAGRRARAEELCREILRAHPERADVLHLLGVTVAAGGDVALAVACLERAAAVPGTPARVHGDLAKVYRREGRPEAAIDAARRAVAADPAYADGWHVLGLTLHERGAFAESREPLERAVALDPGSAAARINLGNTLQLLGDADAAEAAYRDALCLEPESPGGHNNLAMLLYERRAYEEAAHHARACVAAAPGAVPARVNLGNILRELGDPAGARDEYLEALRLDPAAIGAHNNLAVVLCELGSYDEARAHADRALALDPGLVEAQVNAAVVDGHLLGPEAALRRLDAALALAPAHLRGLQARAAALVKVGRPEEALASAHEALRLAPEDGEGHVALGEALHGLGRYAEAIAAFERAESLVARPGAVRVRLATLALEQGRRAEGLARLNGALAAEPNLAVGWYVLAGAKKLRAEDPEIAAIERLADDPRTLVLDRILLEFALGKAYLDAGDAARAFARLASANARKRASLRYDVAVDERAIEEIAVASPPELFERLAGAGEPSALPVFVVGMPRSGTTLIEQILASHPAVHGAGELALVHRIAQQPWGPDAAARYPAYVGALRSGELWAMGRQYLAGLGAAGDGRLRVVDKMPSNFLFAGLIRLMLPGARIVHVVRDPLDTCLSIYATLFDNHQDFAYDLTELGRFYRAYAGLTAHWRTVLPASAWLEVRYEDVVDDLEREARRLTDFCGLPWDDAVLRFHATERAVRTASLHQVREPVYRTSVGRARAYREHLGPLIAALDAPA